MREERGLSLEEMARVTRVAPRYLEALEREDLTGLPAPVFTKGYIRAYCQALGVEADEALGRYVEGVPAAAPTPAPAAAGRTSHPRRPRGPLLISFALLVGFGLALFVVAVYLQSGRPEVGTRQAALPVPDAPAPPSAVESTPPAPVSSPPTRPTPVEPPVVLPAPVVPAAPAAPPAVSVPAPNPTPVRQPEPKAASPTESRAAGEMAHAASIVTTVPTLGPGSVVSPYRLIARTSEATWLRVRTEDGRTMEETIPAGEVREWVSNRPFVLTVGNAAGVTLELNGQKVPPLGGRGVVIGNLVLPPPSP